MAARVCGPLRCGRCLPSQGLPLLMLLVVVVMGAFGVAMFLVPACY